MFLGGSTILLRCGEGASLTSLGCSSPHGFPPTELDLWRIASRVWKSVVSSACVFPRGGNTVYALHSLGLYPATNSIIPT